MPEAIEISKNADVLSIDGKHNIDRLLSVEMDLVVRFGTTKMPLSEIVKIGTGSVIELERNVDEPVELLVNNFPLARGQVVLINGYYGVRITEVLSNKKLSSLF
jgi:flagellar motor switch protein FliN/FliY